MIGGIIESGDVCVGGSASRRFQGLELNRQPLTTGGGWITLSAAAAAIEPRSARSV